MECFNTLLLKLRESHEREVEGWQVKIQELSNKKGCDTKRMEELFTKNQQMKEQQRILTENIKTLENRLRAGLCDRCTVTQEVAKRKQHEFEASQMQSFHHISLLAGEINNLKKENKRLKDEVKTLRAALHCSPADVKPNRSPDFTASSGAVALVTSAASIAGSQPADGDVTMKSEEEQRAEDSEHRQWRGNRKYFDSYKPLSTPSPWKTEHSGSYRGERRVQSVDGLDQQSSISPHAILKSSSSPGGEVNHSRHVLHAPVPCRPQPIKSSPVALPWVSSPATNQVLQITKPRFANLIPAGQHDNPKRQGFGQSWHKQSAPKSSAMEPTVLFRLKSLSEHMESQSKPQEKKEASPSRVERVSAGGPSEVCEGPLDLSDRGKSKSSQSPTEFLPLALEREQNSPDKDVKNKPSTHGSLSPRCGISSSSSPRPAVRQPEGESGSESEPKQIVKEQKPKEEVNGKADQSSEEKVPVLTISLRPAVVMLETLNPALQKQESLTSNEKSPVPTAESESSTDDQENVQSGPGEERKLSCKRKRQLVETESDKDYESCDP